ncbi:hypothetical protein IE81DRAFT_95607 [Ceraceosorus guamensis]|uniref:Uncharacterized protein n=1 Tax=Ceraceosorus guamensis TaxID=1522189 RepID=A0A316W074_9BASI|nr:hypothetical protein IE81DRAFT_95607 [Ceraceosorus guamensis]PWN43317.1 hypothetical protein IE81DRAFT_95607 [Ceraceosorus guamensis]
MSKSTSAPSWMSVPQPNLARQRPCLRPTPSRSRIVVLSLAVMPSKGSVVSTAEVRSTTDGCLANGYANGCSIEVQGTAYDGLRDDETRPLLQ